MFVPSVPNSVGPHYALLRRGEDAGELFTFASSSVPITIPGSVFGYLESGVSLSIRFARLSMQPRVADLLTVTKRRPA